MNKIIIIGRLTKDPELKNTNNGKEVANFTVAVDRKFSKTEERQADFIDCVAWQQSGVFVCKYFRKGDGIIVEGKLESRKWKDKEGNNRISWEVVCENAEFPPSKKSGNGGEDYPVTIITEADENTNADDLPF